MITEVPGQKRNQPFLHSLTIRLDAQIPELRDFEALITAGIDP